MGKRKTGFWKTHPLLKVIIILVVYLVIKNLCLCWMDNTSLAFAFTVYYYMGGGIYILGGLYGIWLDRGCHFKVLFASLVLLILSVIVLLDYLFEFVYPSWKLNGYISWDHVQNALFFTSVQMFSVLGGYILSKIISYFVGKYRKMRGITD